MRRNNPTIAVRDVDTDDPVVHSSIVYLQQCSSENKVTDFEAKHQEASPYSISI